MERQVRSSASSSRVRRASSAVTDLDVGSSVTTQSDVRVPHGSRTLGGGANVPFDEDSTSGTADGGEDDIGNLSRGGRASGADTDGNLGRVGIREVRAGGLDVGPEFTDDECTGRDGESGGDNVGTGINVDDLAAPPLVDDGLESSGIIGVAITLGTSSLDGLEF